MVENIEILKHSFVLHTGTKKIQRPAAKYENLRLEHYLSPSFIAFLPLHEIGVQPLQILSLGITESSAHLNLISGITHVARITIETQLLF